MKTLPALNTVQETENIKAFIINAFAYSGKKTAVIALSGGLDSSTAFALAIKALGPQSLHAYYLPSKQSSPIHLQHIKQLIKVHQLPPQNFHPIPISAIIQKTWRIINEFDSTLLPLTKAPGTSDVQGSEGAFPQPNLATLNRLRLANLAARIRMLLIFDAAKKRDALVIGTENLSEHLLGYYTRFGDEASDLEPLRHLYKTQVIALAKHLKIPQEIITKPPSADLWPSQTDAQELGFTYHQADPILYLLHQNKSIQAIEKLGFDPQLIKSIQNQIQTTAFKHHVPYHL